MRHAVVQSGNRQAMVREHRLRRLRAAGEQALQGNMLVAFPEGKLNGFIPEPCHVARHLFQRPVAEERRENADFHAGPPGTSDSEISLIRARGPLLKNPPW